MRGQEERTFFTESVFVSMRTGRLRRKIEQILKAAFAAPSAGNQQPWEFYVVTNKERIAALSESSPEQVS